MTENRSTAISGAHHLTTNCRPDRVPVSGSLGSSANRPPRARRASARAPADAGAGAGDGVVRRP